jgi:hypothetical protein
MDSHDEKASPGNNEWLDIAWKYFQQHAQQRISYFNFFVIFSTILTTGIVTTFQKTFGSSYLGVALGLLQAFLAFMFLKIDGRNRLLTKHSEDVIRKYESKFIDDQSLPKLFTDEETLTKSTKGIITHGTSYKIIYIFFLLWGLGAVGYTIWINSSQPNERQVIIDANVNLRFARIDSLEQTIRQQDSVTNVLLMSIEKISRQLDTVKIISTTYRGERNQKESHIK